MGITVGIHLWNDLGEFMISNNTTVKLELQNRCKILSYYQYYTPKSVHGDESKEMYPRRRIQGNGFPSSVAITTSLVKHLAAIITFVHYLHFLVSLNISQ